MLTRVVTWSRCIHQTRNSVIVRKKTEVHRKTWVSEKLGEHLYIPRCLPVWDINNAAAAYYSDFGRVAVIGQLRTSCHAFFFPRRKENWANGPKRRQITRWTRWVCRTAAVVVSRTWPTGGLGNCRLRLTRALLSRDPMTLWSPLLAVSI